MRPERVIRGRKVENDLWQVLGLAPEDPVTTALPHGPLLVPLAAWTHRRDELLARGEPTGVWLAPEDDPAALAADVDRLPVVAVRFPKLGDGRGYSTAALLRTRYGYRGELRAFGDLGRDQLFYLERVGFDSFKLAPQHDPDAALAAFGEFTVRYQGAVDDPVPLFRKRAAAGRMEP
ncbi:MAG: DUF934 domain-containing protein [Usitatibacter sp.]